MGILDYTCRARWPFRAFAQESLKTVTSPTSYRKYPQKGPNLGLPRMLIFWFTFISIEIKLHLVSRGTPLFPFFNARLGILKQYCTFQGPKSGPNRWRRTNGRTHERTDAHQKFEASCTKALKGKNSVFFLESLFIRTGFWRLCVRLYFLGKTTPWPYKIPLLK